MKDNNDWSLIDVNECSKPMIDNKSDLNGRSLGSSLQLLDDICINQVNVIDHRIYELVLNRQIDDQFFSFKSTNIIRTSLETWVSFVFDLRSIIKSDWHWQLVSYCTHLSLITDI